MESKKKYQIALELSLILSNQYKNQSETKSYKAIHHYECKIVTKPIRTKL